MSVWIAVGVGRVHLIPEGYGGTPWSMSACGLWRHHGDPEELERGTTGDVTCGRCRRSSQFVVAEREEERGGSGTNEATEHPGRPAVGHGGGDGWGTA